MKLKFYTINGSDIKDNNVKCAVWISNKTVFSFSDDCKIIHWNLQTKTKSLLESFEQSVFPVDVDVCVNISKDSKLLQNKIILLASYNGHIYFINSLGKIEKSIEAHYGAVTCIKCSHDGSSILTAGEDGQVKIWSYSGTLRSILNKSSHSVYSADWSPLSEYIIYSVQKNLIIKPILGNLQSYQWKAHDGLVTKVAWSVHSNLILSGSEDCTFKIWQHQGQILFCSLSQEFPITALAWSPNGEFFVVGFFNSIQLCNKMGYSYALERENTGSILCAKWSANGGKLVAVGSSGQIMFADLIEQETEWIFYEAIQKAPQTAVIKNILNNCDECLEYEDNVVNMCFGYDHFFLITDKYCYVYNLQNWNTPFLLEIQDSQIIFIKSIKNMFALADSLGIKLYSYNGQVLNILKSSNFHLNTLSCSLIALSIDMLCLRDSTQTNEILLYAVENSEYLTNVTVLALNFGVQQLGLNQDGNIKNRKLAIIDYNWELQLYSVSPLSKLARIATSAQSVSWNCDVSLLAVIQIDCVTIWLTYFVEQLELSPLYCHSVKNLGSQGSIETFGSVLILLRKSSGVLNHLFIAPYIHLLKKYISCKQWEESFNLCRRADEKQLWLMLALSALNEYELKTALVTYTILHDALKIKHIKYIQSLTSEVEKKAETLILCGKIDEAETNLLQEKYYLQASVLNIDLHQWNRALQIAVHDKDCLNFVLQQRKKYLSRVNETETDPDFLHLINNMYNNL